MQKQKYIANSRRIFLVAIFTTMSLFNANSQFYHSIYNRCGELRCDPSYFIEEKQIPIVEGFDFSLDCIYNDIVYPQKAWENGICGLVIAKLIIIEGGSSLRCEIVKTPDPVFINPVQKAINNNHEYFFRQSNIDSTLVFYLPFEFEIASNSYKFDLKNYGVYKIRKSYYFDK
jgi:hypothetical protein